VADQIPRALQESILTALAFDGEHGALIAAQVQPDYFDDNYRDIAERILKYRGQYGKPPGVHVDDLFSKELTDQKRGPRIRRVLTSLAQQSDGLNALFVASRTQDWIRHQLLGAAILKAGERYQMGGEAILEDVEGILYDALKYRQQTMDAGVRFSDTKRVMGFLRHNPDVFLLGIPGLDNRDIGPTREELLLYLAPKGSGKSWFCVHAAKQCLLQRAKVLHVSLEMSEFRVCQRYLQAFFSIARRKERLERVELEFDDLRRLRGFKARGFTPDLTLSDPKTKKFLRERLGDWGMRFANLIVKDFPTGTLTMSQFTSYLDYLASVEKFYPDVIIMDYPKLMRLGRDTLRLDLGRTLEELRGVAGERKLAMITPHQGSRQTINAKRTRSNQAGEDISVVQTADTVLAYSRTEAEERLGLGRLSVEHARNEGSGDMILLAQSYATGQYLMESAPMNNDVYWDRLKELTGGDEDDEEQ
jgi:replicative DNA helicase